MTYKLKFVFLSQIDAKRSEVPWSYFHLSPLQGVFRIPPVFPVHTITEGGGIFVTIDAIQVGAMTRVVPPGSVKQTATVSGIIHIIILVSSGKLLTAMINERVASIS